MADKIEWNVFNTTEYFLSKAEEYQEKYGLKKTPGTRGHNDETDAFRHAFMMASFTHSCSGLAIQQRWI